MYEVFEKLLKLNNCSASDVAKSIGVSRSTFSDWKSGRAQPGIKKLQKIADYFGVSIEYLMTGKEAEKKAASVLDLTDAEQLLLAVFRQLNAAGQEKALELVKLLSLDPANKPARPMKPAGLADASQSLA